MAKIDRIIIGPTPHKKLSKRSVEILMKKEGINCKVENSRIPYRTWVELFLRYSLILKILYFCLVVGVIYFFYFLATPVLCAASITAAETPSTTFLSN
ncbi:MAG: hypothetical protein Q8M71_01795, partial [Thermodesulfovibrionales bacterium]|nr:hypothetical protein [Thermodesulfovibrionales bacterium]